MFRNWHEGRRRTIGLLGGSALSLMFLAACGVGNTDNQATLPSNAVIDRTATPVSIEKVKELEEIAAVLGISQTADRKTLANNATTFTYRTPPNLSGSVFRYQNDADEPLLQILKPETATSPAGEIDFVTADGYPLKYTPILYRQPEKPDSLKLILSDTCQVVVLSDFKHSQNVTRSLSILGNADIHAALNEFATAFFDPQLMPNTGMNSIILNFLPYKFPFPVADVMRAGASRRLTGQFLFQSDALFDSQKALRNSVLLNFAAIHGFANATKLSLHHALTMSFVNNFFNVAATNGLSINEMKGAKHADETFSTVAGAMAIKKPEFATAALGTDKFRLFTAYLANEMESSIAT